jgi:transmembrane 9 superfamily protein 2/4
MRLLILLICLTQGLAFYLPGVAPREYLDGENVTVKVNSIKSTETAIPYDYYSIMVCRPEASAKKIKAEAENMGEILWGDSIKPSRYYMQMQRDVNCAKVCTTKPKPETLTLVSKGLKKLKRRIDDEYRGHLILDNLPVSEVYIWEGSEKGLYYRRGYPLGTPGNKSATTLVNNHLAFTVKIHKPDGLPGWRIVGFEVVPYSVESSRIDSECTADGDFDADKYPPQTLVVTPPSEATKSLSWSYSLHWVEDKEVAWSSRWDHYLKSSDASSSNIHWFAIVNSLMIVLCLSAMVAMILLRALHKDFNRYNNPENDDEAQEETGWKVVHADVFRDPPYPGLLSCYVGTGSQLLAMALVTLVFACFGFLSPARRGSLMTAMLVLFALSGSVGGFVAAVMAKMFHEQSWATIAMTGVWLPGKVFVVFFFLNLMLWAKQAANAVPFLMLLGLIALWFFVSIPLVFFGAAVGYKNDVLKPPQSVSQIPRFIPEQKWHMKPAVMVLSAGAVPFGAAFIELYFILSSLWLNKFYYVFGFFAIVFAILIVTCAEISIVLVYFQLCYEDYRWWWRAFLYAGSSGLYLFLYSLQYLTSTLNMTSVASITLYISYMAVLSYGLFVVTGTVGFLSSLVFVRYIYSALKVD